MMLSTQNCNLDPDNLKKNHERVEKVFIISIFTFYNYITYIEKKTNTAELVQSDTWVVRHPVISDKKLWF
jgi:hypothetical protein